MTTFIFDPVTESSIAWIYNSFNDVREYRLSVPFGDDNVEEILHHLIKEDGGGKQIICLSCTMNLRNPYNSFKRILDIASVYPTTLISPASFDYWSIQDRKRSARLANNLKQHCRKLDIGLIQMTNLIDVDCKVVSKHNKELEVSHEMSRMQI